MTESKKGKRDKMKKSRILSLIMALAMIFSTVPVHAAGGETTPTEEGKLFLDKTATLTDNGSYTINMEAFATGKTTSQTIEKGVPLDIVLVLDQSGSMDHDLVSGKKEEALKKAAKNFVERVYQDGQKNNVEHRIGIVSFASGPDDDSSYKNTGIYDDQGSFKGYKSAGKPQYEQFNGTMDPNGIYYVKKKGKYYNLNYVKGDETYVEVSNSEIGRTDLYGYVNSNYEKATYGEYTEKTEVVNPVQGTEGYVDASGNSLTWKSITVPGEKKPGEKAKSIVAGNHYYILYNNQYLEIWQHGTNNWWRDKDDNAYDVDGANFTYGFWPFKNSYPAYEQITTAESTKTVLTTADGKEYNGTVYTHATKTGWNVNGTPVDKVYELQMGAGKWQYIKGGKVSDYNEEQVYIRKLTSSTFKSALVPVADGENGAGNKRSNFDRAINSFGAKGATRTSLGVEMGNKIFEANPIPEGSDRQRIMIVFTDGEPGQSGYDAGEASAAVNQTNITKNTYEAKVYTIGLYDEEGTNQKIFMEDMSSNTDTDKKYYHKVADASALDGVFQSIQQDISGSTTQVELTTTSILRDIMSAEGFELTDKSVVTVSVVPGDATNAADETQIEWGTPKKILTLTNPTDGKTVTGTYSDSTGKDMTIKASTHMKNPEADKADLHTVDVTGFDYKDQYIAKAHKGSKLVVEITGVKALSTVTTDQNIFTNHDRSGIWAPATEGGDRQLKAPFPKRPETHMTSKSYVVDYAKPLDLATTDFKMDKAIDVDKDGYNPFNPANTDIKHTYGNIKVEEVNLHMQEHVEEFSHQLQASKKNSE